MFERETLLSSVSVTGPFCKRQPPLHNLWWQTSTPRCYHQKFSCTYSISWNQNLLNSYPVVKLTLLLPKSLNQPSMAMSSFTTCHLLRIVERSQKTSKIGSNSVLLSSPIYFLTAHTLWGTFTASPSTSSTSTSTQTLPNTFPQFCTG